MLVVRVWIEGDDGLRARVTRTIDLDAGTQVVTAATTPEELYTQVREWIDAYLTSRSDRNQHLPPITFQ